MSAARYTAPPGTLWGMAPHNGTLTSKAAARDIQPHAGTLRARILEHIRSRGIDGATDLEIERDTGIKGSTVRPRRGELRDAGLIHKTDRVRGRAAVWVAGRDPLTPSKEN